MTPEKFIRLSEWQEHTADLPDGAAFAMLDEFDLTMEDVEELADMSQSEKKNLEKIASLA